MEKNTTNHSNSFLGTEKVGKLLLKFSLPCVLSLIIQALYNLVDQIFIGHSPALGATGNAATGIVYPLTVIALGLGLWLGDGAAAAMSISQGKNDTAGTAKSVGNALFFGTAFGAILTVLTLCCNTPLLSAIGAAGEVLDAAVEYSLFISIGFIFFILACVLNPIIRADGSPRFAMLAMAVGAIINIVLDPVFIYAADMGMTGAALATFLGQTVTFILHVAYLFKSKTFKIKRKDFLPSFPVLGKLLKYGISSFLTQLAIVIISVVNNALLKVYSTTSGYDPQITQGVITLAFKVFGIVVSIIVGIASGGQPILGYNYGAKKYNRVRKTYKYILLATLIVGVIATVLFEACPKLFLMIFGDGGDKVDKTVYAQFTVLTFRSYLGFIALTCIIKVSAIFLQSIGKPVLAATLSMCRDVVFLVPSAIVMCVYGGVDLLLWSAPISDVLSFAMCTAIVWLVLNKMPKTDETENAVDACDDETLGSPTESSAVDKENITTDNAAESIVSKQ